MGAKRRAAANERNSRRSTAYREMAAGEDRFPWIISLTCLFAGIYLFMSSTVPALRESRELHRAESRYRRAVERVEDQTLAQRRRLRRLPRDPEVILVEFDRQGMLPEQAIERYQDHLPKNSQPHNR